MSDEPADKSSGEEGRLSSSDSIVNQRVAEILGRVDAIRQDLAERVYQEAKKKLNRYLVAAVVVTVLGALVAVAALTKFLVENYVKSRVDQEVVKIADNMSPAIAASLEQLEEIKTQMIKLSVAAGFEASSALEGARLARAQADTSVASLKRIEAQYESLERHLTQAETRMRGLAGIAESMIEQCKVDIFVMVREYVRRLDNRDQALRTRAVSAIQELHSWSGMGKTLRERIARETVEPLTRMLEDDSKAVRIGAAATLAKFGSIAVRSLVLALRNEDQQVRRIAISGLSSFQAETQSSLSVLADALTGTSGNSRLHTAFALGEIGPAAKEAVPSLLQSLIDWRDQQPSSGSCDWSSEAGKESVVGEEIRSEDGCARACTVKCGEGAHAVCSAPGGCAICECLNVDRLGARLGEIVIDALGKIRSVDTRAWIELVRIEPSNNDERASKAGEILDGLRED